MRKTLYIFTASVLIAAGCSSNTSQHQNANDHSSHATRTNSNATNVGSNAAPAVDHSGHGAGDHSAMQSSPGAATAPFELQFLDTMIAHHQGAVDMAELAETRAERPEVKELAANIISEQEREIAKMTEWRDGWFDGKTKAINMDFPGMTRGMAGMDMKKLESLKGRDFDMEFLRQMIPHHEGAIEMAEAVRKGQARAELKEIAEEIIKAQEAEIKQMREWMK